MQVAETIRRQINAIDRMAFAAWGAKHFVVNDRSLTFSTSGSVRWKGKVTIKLNERDLYDVRFTKLGRYLDIKEDVVHTDVFVEGLVQLIDGKVG